MQRQVRWRLRPPPRSPAQTEISQFNANRLELAAICAPILSLQFADWIAGTVLRSKGSYELVAADF